MFNVFMYLIEHFQSLNACPERFFLEQRLENAGFEENEIDQAFGWMDKIRLSHQKPNLQLQNSQSFRIFSQNEQLHLTEETLNLLTFLHEQEIIDNCQRELIIDTLMEAQYEVTVNHAKMLVLAILWMHEIELPILIGEDLLSVIHEQIIPQ